MAASRRLIRQSPLFIQQCGLSRPLVHARALSVASRHSPRAWPAKHDQPTYGARRTFTSSRCLTNTGQDPPSARSYIDSGVISGAKNLVNVKKVLVIGSGGLSIGQAGEFDYSGQCSSRLHQQLVLPSCV